jgi:hypothetical protein
MQLSSFQCFIGQESNIKCIRQHHNGGVFIPALHWTRIPYKMYKTASQWSCHHSSVSLDKQSNIKCIRQHHNVAVFIPVLYILYWIIVQWNTGMKTAPLWCCLIHFIWDSCPMKCWNEDTSIVMLSCTFYMGFLSNEVLEWRQLHCDAVLYILYWIACPMKHWNDDSSIVMLSYILYGILVHWSAGMKTPPLWCCLIHFILDSCPMKHWNEDSCIVMLSYTFYMGFLSNETLEWRQLHCDASFQCFIGQ